MIELILLHDVLINKHLLEQLDLVFADDILIIEFHQDVFGLDMKRILMKNFGGYHEVLIFQILFTFFWILELLEQSMMDLLVIFVPFKAVSGHLLYEKMFVIDLD